MYSYAVFSVRATKKRRWCQYKYKCHGACPYWALSPNAVQSVLSPQYWQYPDFQQTLLRNAGHQTWASNREIGSKAPPSVHNSLFIITLKWVWQKYTFFSWCNWYRHILNHWWSCFYKSLILPPSAPIHLNEMRKPWLIHFDRRTCKKYYIKNAKNICEKSQNIWKV